MAGNGHINDLKSLVSPPPAEPTVDLQETDRRTLISKLNLIDSLERIL